MISQKSSVQFLNLFGLSIHFMSMNAAIGMNFWRLYKDIFWFYTIIYLQPNESYKLFINVRKKGLNLKNLKKLTQNLFFNVFQKNMTMIDIGKKGKEAEKTEFVDTKGINEEKKIDGEVEIDGIKLADSVVIDKKNRKGFDLKEVKS